MLGAQEPINDNNANASHCSTRGFFQSRPPSTAHSPHTLKQGFCTGFGQRCNLGRVWWLLPTRALLPLAVVTDLIDVSLENTRLYEGSLTLYTRSERPTATVVALPIAFTGWMPRTRLIRHDLSASQWDQWVDMEMSSYPLLSLICVTSCHQQLTIPCLLAQGGASEIKHLAKNGR